MEQLLFTTDDGFQASCLHCCGVRETVCYRQIFCHIYSAAAVNCDRRRCLEPTSMFVFPLIPACISQYTCSSTTHTHTLSRSRTSQTRALAKGYVFVTLVAFVFAFRQPSTFPATPGSELINLCMHSYKMHFGAVFAPALPNGIPIGVPCSRAVGS